MASTAYVPMYKCGHCTCTYLGCITCVCSDGCVPTAYAAFRLADIPATPVQQRGRKRKRERSHSFPHWGQLHWDVEEHEQHCVVSCYFEHIRKQHRDEERRKVWFSVRGHVVRTCTAPLCLGVRFHYQRHNAWFSMFSMQHNSGLLLHETLAGLRYLWCRLIQPIVSTCPQIPVFQTCTTWARVMQAHAPKYLWHSMSKFYVSGNLNHPFTQNASELDGSDLAPSAVQVVLAHLDSTHNITLRGWRRVTFQIFNHIRHHLANLHCGRRLKYLEIRTVFDVLGWASVLRATDTYVNSPLFLEPWTWSERLCWEWEGHAGRTCPVTQGWC